MRKNARCCSPSYRRRWHRNCGSADGWSRPLLRRISLRSCPAFTPSRAIRRLWGDRANELVITVNRNTGALTVGGRNGALSCNNPVAWHGAAGRIAVALVINYPYLKPLVLIRPSRSNSMSGSGIFLTVFVSIAADRAIVSSHNPGEFKQRGAREPRCQVSIEHARAHSPSYLPAAAWAAAAKPDNVPRPETSAAMPHRNGRLLRSGDGRDSGLVLTP